MFINICRRWCCCCCYNAVIPVRTQFFLVTMLMMGTLSGTLYGSFFWLLICNFEHCHLDDKHRFFSVPLRILLYSFGWSFFLHWTKWNRAGCVGQQAFDLFASRCIFYHFGIGESVVKTFHSLLCFPTA